ncbi:Aldehyde/histidinol dehydrogenase [Mycena amicta]|nr:Aldehyde/histidinol dehydrogenase [Mycena amicta]
MSTVPLLIKGEERISASTFPVVSPVSHQALYACSSASAADTDLAIAAATAAFPESSKTKPGQRRTIRLRAADLLEDLSLMLKESMMLETGSTEAIAEFNIRTMAEFLRDTAGKISASITGSIPVSQDEGTSALVLKEPYGVVLSIAPWTEAGLPAGVLNILYTTREESPAITTQLIEAPAIRKINFTGSTAVGAIIAAAAGRALKPCVMELGGKAAAIILDDADLELAAIQCVIGAFLHAGQICMSTEHIMVNKTVLDAFRPALQKAVAGFSPENAPSPVLAQGLTVAKNRALVADAVGKGARLLHRDYTAEEAHPETGDSPSSTRLRPIIVEGVTKEMDLYTVESFGPSVSLIVVESEEEAVRIANDSDYGLNAAIFTRDLARGLRVAKRLECGNVHINSMSVHDEAALPHGGVKNSGWGRFNGKWGLDEFLRSKTTRITFKE